MKYILKVIVRLVTLPVVLFWLLLVSLLWLGFYCWGSEFAEDAGDAAKSLMYTLWHFKPRPEEGE